MNPNNLSMLASQHYSELLAEASARRPGRLMRDSSEQELDYTAPLTRGNRFGFPRPKLSWPRMPRRQVYQAER